MGTFFRLVFTLALIYGFLEVSRASVRGTTAADLTGAFWLAFCVVIGLCAAIAWVPVVARRLWVDPTTSPFAGGYAVEPDNLLMRVIRRCHARRHRRAARWLCFVAGVRHPWVPTPFVIGLANAEPGSWLERVYAREVYRSDNVGESEEARKILRQLGEEPHPHRTPTVRKILEALDRHAAADRPLMTVPKSQRPPLKRNLRIQLPEPKADGTADSGEPREEAGGKE